MQVAQATEKQIKYIYALEKRLGRMDPKWREGITAVYAQSLIEELLGELGVEK